MTPDNKKISRRDALPKDSQFHNLPDLYDDGLLKYWYETGRYTFGMSGIQPITWVELQAYLNATGYYLSNWELHALRYMSVAYVGEYHQAKNNAAPSPIQAQIQISPPADVSSQLKNALRSIGKKR